MPRFGRSCSSTRRCNSVRHQTLPGHLKKRKGKPFFMIYALYKRPVSDIALAHGMPKLGTVQKAGANQTPSRKALGIPWAIAVFDTGHLYSA